MIRVKSTFFVIILMMISMFAIGITAENTFVNNKQVEEENDIINSNLFDAEITFYILTGEGCACIPIPGAKISAYGGEGNDSRFTDDDGMCVLSLVILGEYEVIIEADEYQTITFEFNVIDDQTFTFHMHEKRESSKYDFSFLSQNIIKILSIWKSNIYLRIVAKTSNIKNF